MRLIFSLCATTSGGCSKAQFSLPTTRASTTASSRNEFRRQQEAFTADVLCTVRLSRRLYPNATGHGPDAIITRHHLDGFDRHRAMGDTEATAAFVQNAADERLASTVAAAVRALLRTPSSLPANLPAEALQDTLPAGCSPLLRHQRHADLHWQGKTSP
ncbi:MAG: hypothetical protein U1F05_06990 [Burkholderiales bacterium]